MYRQQQGLQDELLATQKENLELKNSLAQLRKSNVQVCTRKLIAVAFPHPSDPIILTDKHTIL